MAHRDIVVVGASAGGVDALTSMVAGLNESLDAAIFVVLHVSPHAPSLLHSILNRSGKLPVLQAAHGMPIRSRQVYVAPPDRHMVLTSEGRIALGAGPRENGHRPAVDPLFRSAARCFGPRVIGIILSGVLDDGSAGLLAVKSQGGIAIVQSTEDALYPAMPLHARNNVKVDHVVRATELGTLLLRLVPETVPDEVVRTISPADRALLEEENFPAEAAGDRASGLVCPECHGALWELRERDIARFRCRVGHAYSAETLLAHQQDDLDEALWTAFRALKENAFFARKLATRAQSRDQKDIAKTFENKAEDAEARAKIVERLLVRGEGPAEDSLSAASARSGNGSKAD